MTTETMPETLEDQISSLEQEMEEIVKKNAAAKGAANGFPALAHSYVNIQTRLDVLYDKQQKEAFNKQMDEVMKEIGPILQQQDWTEVQRNRKGDVSLVWHFPSAKYPEGKLTILGV